MSEERRKQTRGGYIKLPEWKHLTFSEGTFSPLWCDLLDWLRVWKRLKETDRANESRHVVLSVVSSHLHTVMMSGASVTHPAPVQMLCCSQVWCAGLPSAPSRDQLLGHFSTTKCCSFKYVLNQDNCSDSNQRPQSSEIQGSIKPSEPHQHVTWCLFFPCLVLWLTYLRFYSIYVSM